MKTKAEAVDKAFFFLEKSKKRNYYYVSNYKNLRCKVRIQRRFQAE